MHNASMLSAEEWERREREEHDLIYENSLPFGLKDYIIDPHYVIWWEDYCYKHGRRPDRGHRTKRVFELIDLENLKHKTILDLGCGNGQYSVFLALLGATVYGIDLSPVGIQVASKIASANHIAHKCHFSVQNASRLDFKDSFFDIVLLHEVLHHAIKYPNVKDEVFRVLKKGGRVVCAETLRGNFLFQLGRFFTMRGHEAKGDVIITPQDLDNFALGFSDYQVEMMSLLFMCKRIFQNYLHIAPIRWIVFFTKKIDDILLKYIPHLSRYCGECILTLVK